MFFTIKLKTISTREKIEHGFENVFEDHQVYINDLTIFSNLIS